MAAAMGRGAFTIVRHGRPLDADRRTVVARDVLIEGDTIREVGPPGLAAPEGARTIDASGRMLIPGLVNAHTHGHGSLGKGRGDRWSLELLLNAAPWINGGRTHADRRLATLLNAAEMIRRGCTAVYDLTWEMPAPSKEGVAAVREAYEAIGMRALIAPMLADRTLYEAVPGLMDALPEAARAEVERSTLPAFGPSLDAMRTIARGWRGGDRLAFGIAPTIPHHCSDAMLRACGTLAAEEGLRLHTHLAESKVQALTGLRTYGRTLAAHLDSLGLIGPGFTGAHAVWLDESDIRRLKDRGASIAHNPGSNLRLGNGIAPVRRMLDAGLAVGIGSDGSNSSDNQNVIEAMRFASYVSRIRSHDVNRWVSADEAFRMATEGGAATLGLAGRLGRIEPGYLADIAFLDLSDLAYVPLNDPVSQLVHADDGGGVDSVMIGGRMVYENRRFLTVDIDTLRREVEAAMDRLNAATEPQRAMVKRLEPLVARFCSCFAAAPYHAHRMGEEWDRVNGGVAPSPRRGYSDGDGN
jgi:guanine deaminase